MVKPPDEALLNLYQGFSSSLAYFSPVGLLSSDWIFNSSHDYSKDLHIFLLRSRGSLSTGFQPEILTNHKSIMIDRM